MNDPLFDGLTETQNYFSTRDSTFKTGPQNGGVFDGTESSYIYMNSLRKKISNSNAILASPQITSNESYHFCLQYSLAILLFLKKLLKKFYSSRFWYQMYGSSSNNRYPIEIGNLTLHQLVAK